MGVVVCACNPMLGGGDRQIPEAHWKPNYHTWWAQAHEIPCLKVTMQYMRNITWGWPLDSTYMHCIHTHTPMKWNKLMLSSSSTLVFLCLLQPVDRSWSLITGSFDRFILKHLCPKGSWINWRERNRFDKRWCLWVDELIPRATSNRIMWDNVCLKYLSKEKEESNTFTLSS